MYTTVKSGHVSLTLERSNRLLVWGGYNNVDAENKYCPSSIIHFYDPFCEQWILEETNGKKPPGTSGAAAVIINDYLYVVGGYCQSTEAGNTNNVYQLHLPTKQWLRLKVSGKKIIPVDKFCIWNDNDRIYIFGGFGLNPASDVVSENYKMEDVKFIPDDHPPLYPRGWNNQFAVLDTKQKRWSWPKCEGAKPGPRAAHACAKLGRKIYVNGGRCDDRRMNDMYYFDLTTQTWNGPLLVAEPVPSGRSWHSLTPISDTKLALYGGLGDNQEPLSDCWLFDSQYLCWSELQRSNSQPRLWHTANFSTDNELIILGGFTNNIQLSYSVHAREMIVVNISPKSLLRLCLDKVVMDGIDVSSWNNLPRPLDCFLRLKKLRNNLYL